jgi:hypothetical protein
LHGRREFIVGSAALAALPSLSGCADGGRDDYRAAADRLRAPISGDADFRALVCFASLAANGHNTQPWRFARHGSGASILPDFSCRTPVVDPDDHHLFVSLGCAAENFLIAAGANGRPGALAFEDGRLDIDLASGPARTDALYRAIPARQSTRSDYDGRAIPGDALRRLEAAARIEGVSVILITDRGRRETVLEQLVRANSLQMDDPAFVEELRDWIRFDPSQALATGDGLFTRCSGSATSPPWLGRRMFGLFFRKAAENAKYVRQMRSSAGVAVFIGDRQDADHRTRVGRSFQRFALQATALGIRHAHINQLVEVPSARAEFARWLGLGAVRPDLAVRFGVASAMPMSMRRPAGDVIVARA